MRPFVRGWAVLASMIMAYIYNTAFYDYLREGSVKSARKVAALLSRDLSVTSVLDLGCGEGAWLSVWREMGVEEIVGVDGDYVDRSRCMFPAERFVCHDLSRPLRLDRRFDLVECLEVAEHIPHASAGDLVDSLTAHGDIILFSAAPPGQGGEFHINEQPYDYWRDLFRKRGYVALDAVRPGIRGCADVASWYRYNIFVFVKEERLADLPRNLRDSVVQGTLTDISPPLYRIQKMVIHLLSPTMQGHLAQLRNHLWMLARG